MPITRGTTVTFNINPEWGLRQYAYIYQGTLQTPTAEGIVVFLTSSPTYTVTIAVFSGTFQPNTTTYTDDWVMVTSGAPTPAAFAVGAVLTGAQSSTTATVLVYGNTTTYLISKPSGNWTDGEIVSDGVNSIDNTTGYPQSFIYTFTIGTAATTNTTVHADNVLVEGDYSGSSDIFRQICSVMTGYGATAPSGTDQKIVLNMKIFIGWRKPSSITKAVSKYEVVSMVGSQSGIAILGIDDTYYSLLQLGEASYSSGGGLISDWTAPFPPVKSRLGSTILAEGSISTYQNYAFYVNSGGALWLYASDIGHSGSGTLPYIIVYGRFITHRSNLTDNYNFAGAVGCRLKISHLVNSNTTNGFGLKDTPIYMGNVKVVNPTAYWWSGYQSTTQAVILSTEVVDNSGAKAGVGNVYQVYTCFHLVDCSAGYYYDIALAAGFLINHKRVTIRVVDYLGNPIEGAVVSFYDKRGYDANFYRMNVSVKANQGATATTLTPTAMSYNYKGSSVAIAADDLIRCVNEVELVTSIGSGVLNVSRRQENLPSQSNQSHPPGFYLFIKKLPKTNSQGYVYYTSFDHDGGGSQPYYAPLMYKTSEYYFPNSDVTELEYQPFTLKISHPNYETLTIRNLSFVDSIDSVNLTYKLRSAASQGRDDMGSIFQ